MIVGILGAGQLARMLAQAGILHLGQKFLFLSPETNPCAAPFGEHLCAGFDDDEALSKLAERSDIVTFEFENVPAEAIRQISQKTLVFPSAEALAIAQDRLLEKRLFQELDIPVPPFAAVDSLADLQKAATDLGFPAVLKTRRQGYDGKGQAVLRCQEDVREAWRQVGEKPAILEPFLTFEREVSILGVRSRKNETLCYPLTENLHFKGILRLSTSLADDPMQEQAEVYARRLLTRLQYVGVLTLEFFQVGDTLIANEFAPRVHNSGHWTIEGSQTSQFENHLRAVAGWPLGSVEPTGMAAMVNFIGALPPSAEILKYPGVHLHTYGKTPRPGRKIGHATVIKNSTRELEDISFRLLALSNETGL